MKGAETLFSSVNQGWGTPKSLFEELKKEFDIKLDACTSGDNPLNTPFFYSLDQDNDGLKLNWITWTFCNPPYGRRNGLTDWLDKAIFEQQKGIKSILLLPSRTGTIWFHKYVYNKPNVETRFLKGRLRFDSGKLESHYDRNNSAPFDSMFVIFK